MAKHFVFPDRAVQIALHLRDSATAGRYDGLDLASLAETLTADLRAASGDLHFSVAARSLTATELGTPAEHRWKLSMPGAEANFGIQRAQFADGVGLLVFTALSPVPGATETAHAAMTFLRHSRALVLDLRGCPGGDPDLIALFLAHLFGDDPVDLCDVTWRDTGIREPYRTTPSDARFRFAADVAVFAVVGSHTASGGEAFAYELQARGRGTVIGQPTLGAAHRIKQFEVAGPLVVTVPVGKVTHPVTGGDWEGHGVRPDVVVEGNRDARDVALRLAGG